LRQPARWTLEQVNPFMFYFQSSLAQYFSLVVLPGLGNTWLMLLFRIATAFNSRRRLVRSPLVTVEKYARRICNRVLVAVPCRHCQIFPSTSCGTFAFHPAWLSDPDHEDCRNSLIRSQRINYLLIASSSASLHFPLASASLRFQIS